MLSADEFSVIAEFLTHHDILQLHLVHSTWRKMLQSLASFDFTNLHAKGLKECCTIEKTSLKTMEMIFKTFPHIKCISVLPPFECDQKDDQINEFFEKLVSSNGEDSRKFSMQGLKIPAGKTRVTYLDPLVIYNFTCALFQGGKTGT